MKLLAIAEREIKLGFRNPWSYSFLGLFTIFSTALLLIQSQGEIGGYTHTTGTMLNLILYLLPLMALLLGSFSVTAEKEEGGWHLLATYPLSSPTLLWGKYIGLTIVLFTIISFGYGFSGLLGFFTGKSFTFHDLMLYFIFSILIVVLFLGLAILLGALSANRWQALTVGVGLWFLLILGWPTLLVSVLGFLPYPWIKPVLESVTFLNPAEFIRIFVVMKLGGGAVFGPEYYQWIRWVDSPTADFVFVVICFLWIGLSVSLASWIWERGRTRG